VLERRLRRSSGLSHRDGHGSPHPPCDLEHVATGRSYQLFGTYARWIKNTSGTSRKSPPRPAAKAPPAEAPNATVSEAPPPAASPAPSVDLEALRQDLQRVNREISRIARETRGGPDAARHSQLPEKQDLLAQKQDLERKIRTLSSSSPRRM